VRPDIREHRVSKDEQAGSGVLRVSDHSAQFGRVAALGKGITLPLREAHGSAIGQLARAVAQEASEHHRFGIERRSGAEV
jgi:hypothetical protein